MSSRVYIGRLNNSVREKDVEKFFSSYGRVREILLKNGYGFVEFDDYRDADDAVYELNGKELCGDRVLLEHARGPARRAPGNFSRDNRDYGTKRPTWLDKYGPPTRTDYRVTIENLSSRVSWQDLKDYVRQAGEVTYAEAHRDKKNVGIVEFQSYKDMKNAIEKLNGSELNGRKLVFIEDYKPRSKRRSTSRSRSRSYSRSRSRRRSNSRSRSDSRSRSRSRKRERSRSSNRNNHSRSRSDSRSRSRSPRDKRQNTSD